MRGTLSLHALAWLGATLTNAAAAQPTTVPSVATPARGRAASAELVMRIDQVPVYAQPFDVAQLKREVDKAANARERSVIEMKLRPRPIATLKSGARVRSDWRDGDWYRVRLDDGRLGWVLRVTDAGISNFAAASQPVPRITTPAHAQGRSLRPPTRHPPSRYPRTESRSRARWASR